VSRKFVTEREIAFIDAINKELLQDVVQQEVLYYAISQAESQFHPLYGESIRKAWCAPVRTNPLVQWDNPNEESTGAGVDSKYNIEAYFYNAELRERNLVPKTGDFVEFGQIFFEITSVTEPQLVFGQINNKVMTKCVGVPAREGQFQAGNQTDESVDRTHPVESSSEGG
jgi:hypothetical protein